MRDARKGISVHLQFRACQRMKRVLLSVALSLTATIGINAQVARANVDVSEYPFTLTTDAQNPTLYYIYTGRDGNSTIGGCVFSNEIPYGDTVQKLVLSYPNPYKAEPTQLWYFMEGESGGVKIIPAADGCIVTVKNTQNGAKKVFMKTEEECSNDFHTWTLDQTNGFYAFKTSDGKNFLSHYGGWSTGGPQMGLYNADGAKDEGSRVFFVPCTIPDGINTATTNCNATKNIYTITGRRVPQISTPGIYIVNGVKLIFH